MVFFVVAENADVNAAKAEQTKYSSVKSMKTHFGTHFVWYLLRSEQLSEYFMNIIK